MREISHWRAHDAALTSVEYVSRGEMVVTASVDCNVILWSIRGVRVGNFGRDSWVASDPSTCTECGLEKPAFPWAPWLAHFMGSGTTCSGSHLRPATPEETGFLPMVPWYRCAGGTRGPVGAGR